MTKRNQQANPFIMMDSADDRLQSWKELRREISNLSEKEALDRVAEYWANAPLSSTSYDCESPHEWPSPWEMVSRGDWCRNMLAVAMEITLRLSGWDASRLTLLMIRDYDISEEVFVLKIDDQYALNYIVGEVVEYPNTEQIVTSIWQFHDRNYRKPTN